jgi:hypothetical protein
MAPSEPSSSAADVVFVTVTAPNSSDAKVLKSNPRVRLPPASEEFPPATDWASIPFSRVSWKSPLRPRMVTLRPSPLSRSIETPGRR